MDSGYCEYMTLEFKNCKKNHPGMFNAPLKFLSNLLETLTNWYFYCMVVSIDTSFLLICISPPQYRPLVPIWRDGPFKILIGFDLSFRDAGNVAFFRIYFFRWADYKFLQKLKLSRILRVVYFFWNTNGSNIRVTFIHSTTFDDVYLDEDKNSFSFE